MTPNLKIGLFSIGLDTYWDQFEGLKSRLEGYTTIVENQLKKSGHDIINFGLIDNSSSAFEAGIKFKEESVDLIFLYISTYALSSTVLPVVQKAKVPVIILNLTPVDAIDYNAFNQLKTRKDMTGEWLAYCSSCPAPEIANVFKRVGIQFHEVVGILENDDKTWNEVQEWVDAAFVSHSMSNNKLGCMGHYYSGMLDIYTDLTTQYSVFGGHIELIEVDELSALRHNVSSKSIEDKIQTFYEAFDIQSDCLEREVRRAARTSVALDTLVNKYDLGSMAYYYKGIEGSDNYDTLSSIILGTSLLTGSGIPVAGEYEIKNAQAMKIMDCFGAGGSFTEYYALDFKEDVVLMGHDGPGHIAIAQGKTRVKPLEVYHGKVGQGLSIEMTVKNGPVTLLSVVEDGKGSLLFLIAEGESVAGPILEIGNTNSRYKFSIGARNFVQQWNSHGPAHHCAVGVGHIASKIKKLALLLNIECIKIC
ncbi:arabinose isomerase [Zobellia amurskyensis]|uniref:Arabinose isomerase n=1 Tax=Zobellia amurskyensis TaxID=248905 RepID=A0A7X3D2T7_9FLAO|nr:arabinose isomerase [Zobellia amurskyensis]MUH36980.1 arabinose isomerase [Zobellia amurskyensis]